MVLVLGIFLMLTNYHPALLLVGGGLVAFWFHKEDSSPKD